MKEIEKKLPDNQFVRVHRSFIIRTDKIAQIEQPNIILENDKRIIPVGGSYKETLVKKLNLI
jgi:DNA-binding LytR/AlgR family response regulator